RAYDQTCQPHHVSSRECAEQNTFSTLPIVTIVDAGSRVAESVFKCTVLKPATGNPDAAGSHGRCREVAVDPFVAQLAHLCTEHRTRAKWVFVPTHSLGRTLGERIAREGTNWLNLRSVTPLDVAPRSGAPFLVERGIDPSEAGLGPALMMRLLLDLPEPDGYFRALADQPTMAQALWSTVRDLRMAGVKSDDLKAASFESPG